MKTIKAALVWMMLAGAATAQTDIAFTAVVTDPNAPVDVKADSLSVDQATGLAVFVGNVIATQQEMRLAAERVTVDYDEDAKKVRELRAQGKVIFVSPNEEAESDFARYNPEERWIEMWGNVMVVQGGSIIAGERLRIGLATGDAQITGRVRSVFGAD